MPIEIEGLAELSERLSTMPAKAAKRYLARCGDKAAEVVLAAMHETVPVGIGILEEELIYENTFEDVGQDTVLTVDIGPKRAAFWGSLQEFGTRFQKPQRWMSRAWASCKDKCLDVFATEALGILADLENKE
jgi:HK97 gp10 family phage protein